MTNQTNLTPLYRLPANVGASAESGPFQSFYVPQFEVRLKPPGNRLAANQSHGAARGEPLPLEVVRDILQVVYHDSLTEIDSFELQLSNYESDFSQPLRTVRAKYEPATRPEFQGLFDPGREIELRMGYADDLRLMLTGEITTLEPSFAESGGLTLTVRGLNVLHRFRAQQHTYAWERERDSVIAEEIGRNPVREDRPGINFPVRTDPTAKDAEKGDDYVLMNSQYDIVFLLERARRRNYEVVLRETNELGEPDLHLYFGPSHNREAPTYELEWGRSLIAFRPTLSTAKQVSEVVVLGWDRERNRKIEGKASWASLLPKRDAAERARQERLAQAFGGRREIITDQPVRNQRQAEDLAKRKLQSLKKGMVEASGEVVGLPDLRAGRKVQISNLGDRFSGLYYVTESTHTLGSSGYRTSFKARREEDFPQ